MISVITVISILGVAAGVMALVIALAINNGFRSTLQRNLLGATAHVSILEKEPGYGIEKLARHSCAKIRKLPGVTGAGALALRPGDADRPAGSRRARILKGVEPSSAAEPVGDAAQSEARITSNG